MQTRYISSKKSQETFMQNTEAPLWEISLELVIKAEELKIKINDYKIV